MSVLVASRAVIFLASAHGGRAFDEEFISAYSVATPMCRRTPEATGADSVFQHFHSRGIRYDIRKAFAKTCPNLRLTSDPLRSDYALEAMAGTINPVFPTEVTRYRFTLFNRAGNAFYSTSPHKFSKAINNVCIAIDSQSEGRDAQISDDEPGLQCGPPPFHDAPGNPTTHPLCRLQEIAASAS
jgi:hypothetical protein